MTTPTIEKLISYNIATDRYDCTLIVDDVYRAIGSAATYSLGETLCKQAYLTLLDAAPTPDEQHDVDAPFYRQPAVPIATLADGLTVMGTFDTDGTPSCVYIEHGDIDAYAGSDGTLTIGTAHETIECDSARLAAWQELFAADTLDRLLVLAKQWAGGGLAALPEGPRRLTVEVTNEQTDLYRYRCGQALLEVEEDDGAWTQSVRLTLAGQVFSLPPDMIALHDLTTILHNHDVQLTIGLSHAAPDAPIRIADAANKEKHDDTSIHEIEDRLFAAVVRMGFSEGQYRDILDHVTDLMDEAYQNGFHLGCDPTARAEIDRRVRELKSRSAYS